jgi:hypothetical protein
MKRTLTILITILFIMAGCGGCKQFGSQSDEWITVDVTANYPNKELILQDFMDVEYIPLETNDDFVCQDLVLDITKSMILLRNHPGDGNVFIFDRSGKALRKINRKGQGAEEYTVYMKIALDEDKTELFVNDRPAGRILVYDLDGNFKRNLKQNYIVNFVNVYNFDHENLLCNNSGINNSIEGIPPFVLVSKQDGSVTGEIQIPLKEKIDMQVEFEMNNATYYTGPDTYYPIIPYFDDWILVESSSDTVYSYQGGHTIRPIMVRIPSVQSMNPVVFLFPSLFTDRYYFMDAVKKEVDVSKDNWFPTTNLMYDKQEKAIFEYTVYNNDYTDKRPVNIDKSVPVANDEVASWLPLQATSLIEDYEKGKLKGRLKEIAATLDEDSNPVIMLIKHKK